MGVTLSQDQVHFAGIGPTFQKLAEAYTSDQQEQIEYVRNLYGTMLSQLMQMPMEIQKQIRQTLWVPGHRWGVPDDRPVPGPEPCRVMVIGIQPGSAETRWGRTLYGESGSLFWDTLMELDWIKHNRVGSGPAHPANWYVTNLYRFDPPRGSTRQKNWLKDCLPLLRLEMSIVQPDHILLLGAEPLKTFFPDGNATISKYQGEAVYGYRYSTGPESEKTADLAVVTNPAALLKTSSLAQQHEFETNLNRFCQMLVTGSFRGDETVEHHEVRTERQLRDMISTAEADPDRVGSLLAVDAEWNGDHPVNCDAALRTIQFSWAEKKAAAVVIRDTEGEVCFLNSEGEPDEWRAYALLRDFFARQRLCGHFFASDMEWMVSVGIDVREAFDVPIYPRRLGDLSEDDQAYFRELMGGSDDTMVPPCALAMRHGGIDTAYLFHAVEEEGPFGLTSLMMRHTDAPRYDLPLEDWKQQYLKTHKIKTKELPGYGPCPDEILIPYGCYDADVTFRLAVKGMKLLWDDGYTHLPSWEPFWETMMTALPIIEMTEEGVAIDRKLMDHHAETFRTASKQLERALQERLEWPTFNPRSQPQVVELLFGPEYVNNPQMPDHVGSLRLPPKLSTGSPGKDWEKLKERGLDQYYSPSVSKEVLAMLVHEHSEHQELLELLRDQRFIERISSSLLRAPEKDEEGNWIEIPLDEESGETTYRYTEGWAGAVCDDNRVRSNFRPTVETGRWSSSDPPLQNLCFDRKTELLTRRGWVRADELREDDAVAEYWEDGSIDFVVPEHLHRHEYSGDMIHVLGEQIDMLLTPNHRCLVRRRRSDVLAEYRADELPVGTESQHLHAGEYTGGTETWDPDRLAWIAAVQADGSYANGHDGQGVLFSFRRQRKVDRLTGLLYRLLGPHSDGAGGENGWSLRLRDNGDTAIYVGVKSDAARELVALAKSYLGPEKVFGSWVLDMDPSSMRSLSDEVCFWDGLASRGTEYHSGDKRNADWIQALWTLTGVRARARVYHPSNPNAHPLHCVNRPAEARDYTSLRKTEPSIVPWNDDVFCVTVPSSYVVTRRNGKVSVTGNSKNRDPDYERILGKELYQHKLRSMLCAPPGMVLIEGDYVGAELFGMAILSGDTAMIEHCKRNQLPEDHPNHYDIHSNVAKLAFQLECEASKKGLKDAGLNYVRTLAKNVIFGIAYGRTAPAIALQARQQGVQIADAEAQQIIDTIFDMYPNLQGFYEGCRRRVQPEGPGWLCNAFGRFRRLPPARDFKLQGEIERQAMNFPIQSLIASVINRAARYLVDYRDRVLQRPNMFKLQMQIHDALVVKTHPECVAELVDEVMPYCMSTLVPILPTDLSGVPMSNESYHLGIDFEVGERWGEEVSAERGEALGLPAETPRGTKLREAA